MLVLLLLAAPLAVILFHYFYTSQEYFEKAFRLPGPKRLPILGNTLEICKDNFDILKTLGRFVNDGDGLVATWFGYKMTVLISAPEYLQTLCTCPSTIYRSDHYAKLGDTLGHNGMVTSSGATWKQYRRDVATTFMVTPMDLIVDNMRLGSEFLMNYVRKIANKEEATPMYIPLRITTATTVLKNMLDDRVDDAEFAGVFLDRLGAAADVAFVRQFELLGRYDATFNLTSRGRQYQKDVETVKTWTYNLLNRSYSNYKRMKAEGELLPNVWAYDMFERYPDRTVSSMCDEFLHIFAAGLDTTAGTMGYVLVMLAMHPDIQDKVYEELKQVDKVLGGRPATHEDLNHYQVLERAIKETLRLFPPVALHGRKMMEDTYFGKYLVPKGANVATLMNFQFRSDKVFSDPHKYDPDRFLPENFSKLPPYAYCAFGGGPRSCFGARYAMAGMRLILTDVLREFSVTTTYTSMQQVLQNERFVFTLTDANRHPLKFQIRNHANI